jgi:putative endonuclease
MVSKQQTGKLGEDIAADYLQKRGYKILARNFKRKTGEIDIVAKRGRTIVFVEVKVVTSSSALHEKLHYKKQQKITRTGQWYLSENGMEYGVPWQVDLIAVDANSETICAHIEQAVEGCA